MKEWSNRLSRMLRRLRAWLGRVWVRLRPMLQGARESAGQLQVSIQGGEKRDESEVRIRRLAPGELGIFVYCSSCGLHHELKAVCHLCGAALCDDQVNCRMMRWDPELGSMAVSCPECAGARSYAREY